MTTYFTKLTSMAIALACTALFGTSPANATGTHDHHKHQVSTHKTNGHKMSAHKTISHGGKHAMHTKMMAAHKIPNDTIQHAAMIKHHGKHRAKMMAMHQMPNDKVHHAAMMRHHAMMMQQHGGMKDLKGMHGSKHGGDHHAQMQKMTAKMRAKHHQGMAMHAKHTMKMPTAKAPTKMKMAAGKTCGEFMYMKASQCRDARLPKS